MVVAVFVILSRLAIAFIKGFWSKHAVKVCSLLYILYLEASHPEIDLY